MFWFVPGKTTVFPCALLESTPLPTGPVTVTIGFNDACPKLRKLTAVPSKMKYPGTRKLLPDSVCMVTIPFCVKLLLIVNTELLWINNLTLAAEFN